MRRCLFLVIPITVTACEGDDRRARGPSEGSDVLSGVPVVSMPSEATLPSWTVSEDATVSLGGLDAGADYQLYEAEFALRLRDGRIVVANQGTLELRFYGADGAHLETVGRRGDGPGEFKDMWGMARLPVDSLAIWDWRAKRLTIYDHAGTFGRTVTPGSEVGIFFPRLLGASPEGELVLIAGFDPGAAIAGGQGVRQHTVTLLRMDPVTGGGIDTIGRFPAAEEYLEIGDGFIWRHPLPFGTTEHVASAGGRVYVGKDRTGDIRVYRLDGTPLHIIRTGLPAHPVTDARILAYRKRALSDVESDRLPAERRRLEQIPAAERTPTFTRLFADHLGRVWVEPFTEDDHVPRTWTVYDNAGKALARVRLPARARPVDAGENYLLLHSRDDLDVERLSLRSLRAPTPKAPAVH